MFSYLGSFRDDIEAMGEASEHPVDSDRLTLTIRQTDLQEILSNHRALCAALRYWIPDETIIKSDQFLPVKIHEEVREKWNAHVKLLQKIDGHGI